MSLDQKVTFHINSVLDSVSYRIGNVLIDPGDEWDGFHRVQTILLTHAHFDHIYGINRVVELNPEVKIYTNGYGSSMLKDSKKNLSRYHQMPFVVEKEICIMVVGDKESIKVGDNLHAEAIFTPGHNPSCVTWLVGNLLFTGDSYIPGIKTVTNLPRGNKIQAIESEQLIKELALGKQILPGHIKIK